MDSVVTLGAGQAGARLAGRLRAEGFGAGIALLGQESHLPYERPPLSKGVLNGSVSFADCLVYEKDSYAANAIDLMLGCAAVGIDTAGKKVLLANGGNVPYGRLVIATGSAPRKLDCGDLVAGTAINYLHTLEDAVSLRARLVPGRRVLVVGAGLIGLEVASAAVQSGCSVLVVEASSSALARVAPKPLALQVEDEHRKHGVDFRYHARLASLQSAGNRYEACLSTGETVVCDCVVAGIGAVPNVDLAVRAGLAVDNGICVDEFLRSSDENIFAVGDVCAFPAGRPGQRMRLESWRNAEEQAAALAAFLTGRPTPYRPVPWFWSDQYGRTLLVAGTPGLAQRTVPVGSGGKCLVQAYLDAEDRLIGATAFAELAAVSREMKMAERLIKLGARIPAGYADGADLKNLLSQARNDAVVSEESK